MGTTADQRFINMSVVGDMTFNGVIGFQCQVLASADYPGSLNK